MKNEQLSNLEAHKVGITKLKSDLGKAEDINGKALEEINRLKDNVLEKEQEINRLKQNVLEKEQEDTNKSNGGIKRKSSDSTCKHKRHSPNDSQTEVFCDAESPLAKRLQRRCWPFERDSELSSSDTETEYHHHQQ
ncbi:hypothetical protein ACF0H5_011732 [Mactra antiquata]